MPYKYSYIYRQPRFEIVDSGFGTRDLAPP